LAVYGALYSSPYSLIFPGDLSMKIVLSILFLSFTLYGAEKKENQDPAVHDGKPTGGVRWTTPGPKHPSVIAAHEAQKLKQFEETRRCCFCIKLKKRTT
jgi:hypothetical protein